MKILNLISILSMISLLMVGCKNSNKEVTYLHSLEPISSNCYINSENSLIDTFGNEYSQNINTFSMNGTEHFATYYLNKDYSYLIGTIAIEQDSPNGSNAIITIYANNKILYTSNQLDTSSQPIDFSINVNDYEYITITHTGNGAIPILYNWKLE